jgi:hypothetical protein
VNRKVCDNKVGGSELEVVVDTRLCGMPISNVSLLACMSLWTLWFNHQHTRRYWVGFSWIDYDKLGITQHSGSRLHVSLQRVKF